MYENQPRRDMTRKVTVRNTKFIHLEALLQTIEKGRAPYTEGQQKGQSGQTLHPMGKLHILDIYLGLLDSI